jgi:hypothetical protein
MQRATGNLGQGFVAHPKHIRATQRSRVGRSRFFPRTEHVDGGHGVIDHGGQLCRVGSRFGLVTQLELDDEVAALDLLELRSHPQSNP